MVQEKKENIGRQSFNTIKTGKKQPVTNRPQPG
jgi:hypothetical protein